MIVDTDVFIWYLRGYESAARFMDGLEHVALSAVTYMELVQGMRNQRELQALRRSVTDLHWAVLPLTEAITHRAMTYVEEHYLSSSLQMADALIAATCMERGQALATANDKHYRVIAELELVVYRPG